MSAKRKVRRGARPVRDTTPGFKGNLKRFALSFTPSHFKAYWLSKAGLIRVAKLAGLGVLFVVLVFLWYIPQLPNPRQINSQIGQTTTFYARDELDNPGKGTKLYEIHGDENRLVINFDQMPKSIKQATIAIEDKNFYNEGAFSVRGLARAASGVVTRDSSKGGGSTITQQYVKNALLNDQHSYSRKIKELILSIEINQFYSKDDILKLYLNEIPYGNGAYGIEAACRTYFSDKHGKTNCAQNLSLGESALLAGIPNLPSYYSPYGPNKQALIDRQHLILDLMAEQNYVTPAEAKAAYWTVAQIDSSQSSGADLLINKNAAFYSSTTAPSFVYTVQSQLEEQYGAAEVEKGGWKVITTLDPNLQNCAELAIYNPGNAKCKPTGDAEVTINANNSNYRNLVASKGSNSSLVAADPKTGQVLAMVGSYSFPDSQINMATTPRQPGSSFKPYVYAQLMSKNKDGCTGSASNCQTYGAGSILQDTIAQGNSFGTYKPRDFGGSAEVGGPVTLRTALAGSLNIPAVQALQLAGVPQTIELAKSMGITTLDKPANNYGLSLVLGSGEISLADHVNAYESFANGGVHYEPTMVLQIRDAKNKVKEDNTKPATPKRVLDAQVAYIIANMMSDAGARRYAFQNILDVPNQTFSGTGAKGIAVKTGTTEYFNDAWTMGYTPSLVAGVWAGNNDNAPMTQQAANISGPIWKSFMAAALSGKSAETFAKPSGVKQLPNAGNAAQSSTGTDFFPSWFKQTVRKQIKIDRVSKKLATDCTPALAVDTVLDTGITATDDVHDCGDTKPQVALSGITGGGPYNFNAQVTLGTFGNDKTGNGPQQLQVYFDDQLIQTVADVRTNTYPFSYTPTTSGSHTFKAVVTDSGYYQATDEQTVTVSDASAQSGSSGGGDTFAGRAPANNSTQTSGPVNFTWSAVGGARQYTLYIDGASRTTTPSTSTTYPVVSRQSHTWYVRADTGEQTAPQTFTTQ